MNTTPAPIRHREPSGIFILGTVAVLAAVTIFVAVGVYHFDRPELTKGRP